MLSPGGLRLLEACCDAGLHHPHHPLDLWSQGEREVVGSYYVQLQVRRTPPPPCTCFKWAADDVWAAAALRLRLRLQLHVRPRGFGCGCRALAMWAPSSPPPPEGGRPDSLQTPMGVRRLAAALTLQELALRGRGHSGGGGEGGGRYCRGCKVQGSLM